MAAKRSPILGYNHNVKYRGVVFHVQTEDSGLLNPHLFTHLFHEGVIVSTRKLVYDAGSNEEAVKALMQAQHKAVMKDLMKGAFDDKIDQYLGGTPGLEPSRSAPQGAPVARGERAKTEVDATAVPEAGSSAPQLEVVHDSLSEPIELPLKSRTTSDDRTRPVAMPHEMAAAIQAANAANTPAPQTPAPAPAAKPTAPAEQPVVSRTGTAPRVSRSGSVATPAAGTARPVARASETPVLQVDDELSGRGRAPHDTMVDSEGSARAASPGARAGSTPARSRPDSDAAEIYQPAPASVEPPPGERAERPGQYSVSRKSGEAPIREKTGRIAAINPASDSARFNRPGTSAGPPADKRAPTAVPREPTPRPATPPPRAATPPPTPPAGGRVPNVTAPIANRTPSPNAQAGSGVVMTRPAVIVGAPAKPAAPTQQRVRKAREDEGRGFGQGLISEKSLDEVILAYLSEDAEDK